MKSKIANMSANNEKVLVQNRKLKTMDQVSKPRGTNKRLVLMEIAKGIDGLVVLKTRD